MKLLFLYETVYPDFIGGIELRNHEVAAALCRRGHEVTLAGLCGDMTSDRPNLRILSLGARGGLYNEAGKRSTRQAVRFAAKVARSLDVRPYDVVETANMPYIHLLPLAARCSAAGRPLLVTWYEYWGAYWPGYVGRLRAPAYHAVERLTAQLGDAAAAISELTRARLQAARRRGGRDAVHLVPCGIDVGRVRRAATAGRAVQEGALKGGAIQGAAGPPLIHAGRLLEHKRLDILLRAVELLAHRGEAGSAPLLTIFGEGPDRPRLERLAADLGIAGRVLFRGHVRTSEEVWSEMGRAQIAVQPSAREGFGLFPLEAMAAGLPVVHCRSAESAVGELVRDGIDGIEVAAQPDALAAALARLLAPGGEEEVRRMGRNAQERAALYDWEEGARQIEEICAGLIARRRR
jgi:glycosyltransferase involved in cell wall biosynthesis